MSFTVAEAEHHLHYVPSEKYDHYPVDPTTQLRFLILHEPDTSNTAETPLMGTIVHNKIDSESKWIVLCVVPDSRPAIRTIDTPEGSIVISPALHDALTAIRRMTRSAIMVWTPEISLDFEKDEERHIIRRVRNMKKIYGSTGQFVVFLGTEDEDTDVAHELFSKLASVDMSTAPSSLEDMVRVGLPPIDHKAWEAVDRFICARVIRSIQAVPACVWAKNLQFVGEHWSLDSNRLVAAFVKVAAMQLPLFGQHINSDEVINSALSFSLFCNLRAQYAAFGTRLKFSELLLKSQFVEADSELERLAILAAVSDKGDNDILWDGSGSLKSSDADHAVRIVRYFFDASDESVELLSLARGCARGFDPPSWMPSVSVPNQERRVQSCSDFRTATMKGSDRSIFSDGDRKLTVSCAPVPCSCTGHNVIVVVSPTINPSNGKGWSWVLVLWKHVRDICNALQSETGEPFPKYPGSDDTPLEAAWETLCKGKLCEMTAGHLSRSIASAKAIFMALDAEDFVSVATTHFENSKDAMDYFAVELKGWGFCVTYTGYMGLVPQGAEAKDVIVAVQGARVPFVLREVQGTEEYRLVGECYLHGIMNGELEEKLKFGKRIVL